MSTMYLSVVIPVYDEVDNVENVYKSLCDVLACLEKEFEIVFVDDGSRDGTTEKLAELALDDPRVKVIQFRRNFGQTAALSAGIEMASGDVIVTMDGDMQNDPADIPQMVAKLDEGYDLVHGWRKDRMDAFFSRRLPSKLANWLIAKVTGFEVRDLGCTLKAIKSDVAKDLAMYGEMHRFIPILAHWQGARCAEVVTRHHPRRHGTTKYGIWRTFRVILDLITVKYMIRYSVSPMKLFGSIGLLACLAGLVSLAATIVMKLGQGTDMTGNPLLLLTVFALTVGIQFFVLGLLGEVSARIYHECQGKRPYKIRRLMNFDTDEADREMQYPVRAA